MCVEGDFERQVICQKSSVIISMVVTRSQKQVLDFSSSQKLRHLIIQMLLKEKAFSPSIKQGQKST
jgi:hypothetical protein